MNSQDPSRQSNPSFRNEPGDFLSEALGGFVASHPDAQWDQHGFIGRRSPIVTEAGTPAVAVISGGGSGHEPLHGGFLGEGMLAAVCPGHLFTSPNAVQITEATRWADQGAGVLHVVKNYTGDVMNFSVARQSLQDVETEVVLVADDVATEPRKSQSSGEQDAGADTDGGAEESSDGPGRRGTGATVLVEKVVGAAAYRGDRLADVARLGQWVADNSRSMATALAPGHLPTSGRETFELDAGSMEVGVGIHGERGVDRLATGEADGIVDRLLTHVSKALDLGEGDEVICLVNGLGGTTALELGLVYASANAWLGSRGIRITRSMVGTFVTSLNMAGVSITLTRSTPEVVELLDAPTAAPAWPRVLGVQAEATPATMHFDDDAPTEGEDNAWLSAFVERVQGATEDLTELDRLAGDGDFGANMDAAFGGLSLPLKGTDAEVLDVLARRLFIRAGGTSGAVLGTLFRELAAAMGEDGSQEELLARGLASAVDAIAELGGARPGDNTLVDALVPAADAAQRAVQGASGSETAGAGSFEAVLSAAYDAAEQGALSTREMVAKKGRASYLGEASKGVVDPGAILVAWIFGGTGKVSDFTG